MAQGRYTMMPTKISDCSPRQLTIFRARQNKPVEELARKAKKAKARCCYTVEEWDYYLMAGKATHRR